MNIVMQCHGSNVGPMGHLRSGNGNVTGGVPFLAHALTAHDAKGFDRGDDSHNSKLIVNAITNLGSGGADDNDAQAWYLITHALTGEGFDASEDGTGRGTPIVQIANSLNGNSGGNQVESTYVPVQGVRRLTPTEAERLQGFPDGHTCLCGGADEWRTALRVVQEGALRQGISLGESRGLVDASQASILQLALRQTGTGKPRGLYEGFGQEAGTAIIHAYGLQAVWFDFGPQPTPQRWEHAQQFARELGVPVPLMPYDRALGRGHVCQQGGCLVGESPRCHYWEICWLNGYDIFCTCSDGYRYKCLGNAVTVPVVEWLGRRLQAIARGPLA